MNTLYSNGDSFVFGMEILEDGSREERNKEFSFVRHLASKLGCNTYINNAYNGATNEFIFRNTMFDLLELEASGTKPEDVFVVVGWTSLYREEINGLTWFETLPGYGRNSFMLEFVDSAPVEFKDYRTLFVNPTFSTVVEVGGKQHSSMDTVGPVLVDYLWHENIQLPRQEARVLALSEFLKSKGYKFVFLNTVSHHNFTRINVNDPRFYNLTTDSFYEWASKNFAGQQKLNGHYGPQPHAEYGEILFDYVSKNIV